jgi:hypothetical protein
MARRSQSNLEEQLSNKPFTKRVQDAISTIHISSIPLKKSKKTFDYVLYMSFFASSIKFSSTIKWANDLNIAQQEDRNLFPESPNEIPIKWVLRGWNG